MTNPFEALGQTGSKPSRKLETFPAPEGCTEVRFTTDEFTSFCPVTGNPDFSTVEIHYGPAALCVESKSLKLYLWSYREERAFGETLAALMLADLCAALDPRWCRVVVRQRIRGGLQMDAEAAHKSALTSAVQQRTTW